MLCADKAELFYLMFQKLHLIFVLIFLRANFCLAQKIEHHYFNDLKSDGNPGYWINMDTRKQDAEHADNFFSATDSKKPYGLGFESAIPDDLKKKNVYLFVQGQLRIVDTTQNIQFVTSIYRGDSTIIWKGGNIAAKFGKVNSWTAFHDSLFVPSNIPPDSKFKIYLWNQDGKAEADMDDLDIRFTLLRTPSYIVH